MTINTEFSSLSTELETQLNNTVVSFEDGATFVPSVTYTENSFTISWSNDKHLENPDTVTITAPTGADGVGISDISKTGTSGSEDTYTISLTDGTSTTFTVINGTDGQDGTNGVDGTNGTDGLNGANGTDGNGIDNISKISSSDNIDTYSILLTDGTSTTFTVTNGVDGTNGTNGQDGADGKDGIDGVIGADGQDGADGVGITGISKTSSSGVEDTYTISLTDSSSTTFIVTNGVDGQDGTDGQDGADAEQCFQISDDEPTSDAITVWIDTDDEESIDSTYDRAVAYTDEKVVVTNADEESTATDNTILEVVFDDNPDADPNARLEKLESSIAIGDDGSATINGGFTVDSDGVAYDQDGNKIAGAVASYFISSVTSSTTLTYTGKSVTIPAGSVYSYTFWLTFGYSSPKVIAVSESSTSAAASHRNFYDDTYGSYGRLSITLSGRATSSTSYYIWGSWSGSNANYVGLNGFYIPYQES